jgi:outer membrane protein assembly factor BamB
VRKVVLTATAAIAVAGALVFAYRTLRPHAPTIVGSTTREYTPSVQKRTAPLQPGVVWPTYGYDQQRTHAVSGLGVQPPFRRLWTFHGRALLEFPPVLGYGRLYLTTIDGRLFSLDAATGRTVWRRASGRCGWASPALANHVVYETFIGSRECGSKAADGVIAAFDAARGRLLWRRMVEPTESSPLVADGTVYAGDWSGRLWALDAASGRTRWTTKLHGAIKGSPAISGRRLFIGTYGGDVVSLDALTGRVLWTSGGHGRFYSSPAVAYGRVYIGSLDDGVYAFGASTGHLLWSRPTGGYVYASPAVWDGRVLIGSYDHRFYALDAGTGEVRWRFAANGEISGSAAVIDGVVYFSTFARRTYALRAVDGAAAASWPDGMYSPAVASRGRIYLVGLGRVYALAPTYARGARRRLHQRRTLRRAMTRKNPWAPLYLALSVEVHRDQEGDTNRQERSFNPVAVCEVPKNDDGLDRAEKAEYPVLRGKSLHPPGSSGSSRKLSCERAPRTRRVLGRLPLEGLHRRTRSS